MQFQTWYIRYHLDIRRRLSAQRSALENGERMPSIELQRNPAYQARAATDSQQLHRKYHVNSFCLEQNRATFGWAVPKTIAERVKNRAWWPCCENGAPAGYRGLHGHSY